MKKMLKMLPYLFVCELVFMLCILLGLDTGGYIFLFFILFPIVCFVTSVVYGALNRFYPMQLLFPLFVGILFTVTLYIVAQEIIWVYMVAYTAVSLVGCGAGFLANKLFRRAK